MTLNPLRAVLVGGPPHAGKSILFYHLTRALNERGIAHHAIRACPDGDGNWFQEGQYETVTAIRKENKRSWSSAFVRHLSQDLEHRQLPFLVDMGGYPQSTDLPILRQCTDAILLLRPDQPESAETWRRLTIDMDLMPVAQLYSQQKEPSCTHSLEPFLTGDLCGLTWQTQTLRSDPVFLALVDRLSSLLTRYSLEERERLRMEQVQTEIVINLPEALRTYTTTSIYWQPEMLAPFLQSLPAQTPFSVHGPGPNWLYAALSAYAGSQPFFLFDPKIPVSWIEPLSMLTATEAPSEQTKEITLETAEYDSWTRLVIAFPTGRISYFRSLPLVVPPVAPSRGVILDGPLPQWLLTSLVRHYQRAGVAWIASCIAQQKRPGSQEHIGIAEATRSAIVVASRVSTHSIGAHITYLDEPTGRR